MAGWVRSRTDLLVHLHRPQRQQVRALNQGCNVNPGSLHFCPRILHNVKYHNIDVRQYWRGKYHYSPAPNLALVLRQISSYSTETDTAGNIDKKQVTPDTMCPRNLEPFYMISYYKNAVGYRVYDAGLWGPGAPPPVQEGGDQQRLQGTQGSFIVAV